MKTKAKALIALISALAMLLTGTFAFGDIKNHVNVFTGTRTDEAGIIVRDDYDEGTGKKDVFVENTGDIPLYVRIRLDEYIDLTSNQKPADYTWVTHTPVTSVLDCGNDMNGNLFHDYFKWSMGGSKWYMPTGNYYGSQVVTDNREITGADDGAILTPDAEIIMAAEYLAKSATEQESFFGWIFTDDGNAYWSMPLLSETATGLLLNQVIRDAALGNRNYYYAINVIVEVVDDIDLPMWTLNAAPVNSTTKHDEATDEGKSVLAIIAGLAGNNGNDNEFELEVNNPADPVKGFTSRITMGLDDESAAFTYNEFSSAPPKLDWPGSFRLADVLKGTDYTGLTVTPKNTEYAGKFTIGLNINQHPSIIYSVIPDAAYIVEAGLADMYTTFPVTTELLLTQGDKSATITVTMEYPLSMVTLKGWD